MKVLIDTNVWLDVALGREAFYTTSLTALYEFIDGGDEMCVAATSLKDVFFIVSRLEGADAAYQAVERIMDLATIIPVDGMVCASALPLERPDFEDGIIAAAAQAEEVGLILTRDKEAFAALGIEKMSPVQLMEERGWEEIELLP